MFEIVHYIFSPVLSSMKGAALEFNKQLAVLGSPITPVKEMRVLKSLGQVEFSSRNLGLQTGILAHKVFLS